DSGAAVAARPEEPVTRMETVQILNRALGRSGESVRELDNFTALGTILDVSRKDSRYGDVAEAVLVHRYEERKLGAELWTEAEAIPTRAEGFFFEGVRLHYIGSDGDPAIDCEAKGLRFDKNGVFTTGMPELDAEIFRVLEQQVDPAKMKQRDMLKILYEYCVSGFSYVHRSLYEPGETGWAEEEAYVMFTKGSGNCYNYAAAFYELARAIGCDAKIYSGTIRSGLPSLDSDGTMPPLPKDTPHGWVEINLDGEYRLFDPDMEMANRDYPGSRNFFNRSDEVMRRFNYKYE
ncbi:MAG: transglutaminase domain-containing protein, partial [Oscillospiraceae bacterium]|nr:transglutaminase domain-containing protein [Oscillospiraceae bacterium]